MAATPVRQSGRIKTRKRSHFRSDDFEYEMVKFDLDVSHNISNLLHLHSKEQSSDLPDQSFESFPNISKTLRIKGKLDIDKTSDNGGGPELTEVSDTKPILPQVNQNSKQHSKKKSRKFFNCDECGKIFKDLAIFKRHLRGHAGDRPFKCDICTKGFIESCSLKRHMKTHEDERPFTCDICLKSFRDSGSFSRHQLTHTQRPRSFQCSMCDKSFTDKSGLKRHERTHSGLRPFQCAVCHKTFSESGSFRRHQKIHAGIRDFHCPRCKRSFMEKQSLIRHQKTVCGFWDSQGITDMSHQETIASTSGLTNQGGGNTSDDNMVMPSSISRSSKDDSSNVSSFTSNSENGQQDSSHGHVSSFVKSHRPTGKEVSSWKGSPSLGSLLKKDPNLYDSISEIVDSIDSYEKMLDLCGDNGQKEIDAALTREPSAMPENLMCFECGEVLVNGENFKSEGKSFHTKSYNSFRCFNCEEDEDNYGEPPVLTAEKEQKKENLSSRYEEYQGFITGNKVDSKREIMDSKLKSYVKPLVSFEDDNCKQMKLNSAVLGDTSSTTKERDCEEFTPVRATENCYEEEGNDLQEETMPHLFPVKADQKDDTLPWDNASKNVDYEADDPNIPSVFPCHLCTKVFASSSFLEQHLELHRRSPHKCMVCGKSFKGSPALKRHMRVHTGEKPYVCLLCDKKFRDPSNYAKHKRFCTGSGSVPSPLESTSSSNSVASAVSMEENLEDVQSLSEQEYHKQTIGGKQTSKRKREKVEAQNDQGFVEPMKVFPESFEDFDEQSTESDLYFDEGQQMMNYIPCDICQKLCENQQHLEMHMNYHRENPDVTCIECGKSFSDAHGLKRHMHIHARSRPFTCEYCHRGYCDSWSLKKHRSRGCLNTQVQVPMDFMHPCSKCSRVFSEIDYLEEHMTYHETGNTKFECDVCLKTFSEAFNLRRHKRLHLTICPGCGGEFKSITQLTKHQKKCAFLKPSPSTKDPDDNSKRKNFPCPECGRSYSTLAYLERHRKFHSEPKRYECDICNKKFTHSFKLRRHKGTHTESKPFICQGCGKGFTDEAFLKRHTINSSCTISQNMRGSDDFPCQYCDKVFPKNYMLVRHMNVHSQERPFTCDLCGRAYKDTSSLKRHQLVHQGNKEFICNVCGSAFYYADSLRRHMSGSCNATSKSRRSSKSRRQNKVKSKKKVRDSINNNNRNHKGNDSRQLNLRRKTYSNNMRAKSKTLEKEMTRIQPYKFRVQSDSTKSVPSAYQPLKTIKKGPWSCYSKSHCWRCDTKVPSTDFLMFHVRIHQRKKKFPCLQCYVRFSSKMYWKAHMNICSLNLNSRERRVAVRSRSKRETILTGVSSTPNDVTSQQVGQRPRRSKTRAQWSWLTQI